jgi:hypothetical protein
LDRTWRPSLKRAGVLCALLSTPLFLAPFAARGSHTTFEFKVDRVELVVDGGAPQIDEFDDGVIAPWNLTRGTAFESGGLLVLTNPGVHTSIPGYGMTLDVTTVVRGYSGLTLGTDFNLESAWAPLLPVPPGQRFSMVASYDNGSGANEMVALVLQNLGNAEAAPFGLPSGLRMVQLLVTQVPDPMHPGEFLSLSFSVLESVAVSPADVTGNIVFRIDWNAATRLFTTSFSLDGGTSFQAPFPSSTIPAAALAGGPAYVAMLADPVEVAPKVPLLGAPGRGGLLLLLALLSFASLTSIFPALVGGAHRRV